MLFESHRGFERTRRGWAHCEDNLEPNNTANSDRPVQTASCRRALTCRSHTPQVSALTLKRLASGVSHVPGASANGIWEARESRIAFFSPLILINMGKPCSSAEEQGF